MNVERALIMKNESNESQDVHFLLAELAALRTDLEIEKKVTNRLKNQAINNNDEIACLRIEFDALRSQLTEKSQNNSIRPFEDELLSLRADLEILRCESSAGTTEATSPSEHEMNADDRAKIEEVIHMNELLRRVLQGERIYAEQMHTKLHSLRKKVGPLLAKVDTMQGNLDEIKALFLAHDAPIELIMDFVRMFHGWWVDRYNSRQAGRNDQTGDKGKSKASQGGRNLTQTGIS